MLNKNIIYNLSLLLVVLFPFPSLGCGNDHKNDYREKIGQYTEKIKENPKNHWNYYNRGGEYFHLRDFDNAIADLKQAVKLNNEMDMAYKALSHVYTAKGMHREALESINKAINIDPAITYYYQRAICYDNLKMIPQAIEDYTRFINSKPVLKSKDDRLDLPKEYFNSHKRRALLYFQIQKFEKTVEDVTEALNIYDKDPMLYSMRGHSYYNLGKLDESLNDLEQSIKVDSSYSFSYVQIARVYAARGEKEKTEKYVTRALKKGFSDYEIFYAMTEIVDVLGKERIDALIARYSKKS
jgi:tetratricopeptide (TPR) repeat protein